MKATLLWLLVSLAAAPLNASPIILDSEYPAGLGPGAWASTALFNSEVVWPPDSFPILSFNVPEPGSYAWLRQEVVATGPHLAVGPAIGPAALAETSEPGSLGLLGLGLVALGLLGRRLNH